MRGLSPVRLRKALALLCAVPALGLGIALCVYADLGSDVYTSFQQGIGLRVGLPVGTVNLVMSVVLMALYLAFDRSVVGIGSILMCVLLGPCMTFFEGVLRALLTGPSMPLRLLLTLAGSAVVAFALAFYIPLDMGVQPMDMIILTIARLLGRTYGTALYVFNAVMLLLTLILGGAVGVGTVVNLLCVGKCIDFLMPRLQPLMRRIEGPGGTEEAGAWTREN